MKIAYLFKIRLWQGDPMEYILVYSDNEQDARILGSSELKYNSGQSVTPKDLKLVTYGI